MMMMMIRWVRFVGLEEIQTFNEYDKNKEDNDKMIKIEAYADIVP